MKLTYTQMGEVVIKNTNRYYSDNTWNVPRNALHTLIFENDGGMERQAEFAVLAWVQWE